jgi:hypothetical protein
VPEGDVHSLIALLFHLLTKALKHSVHQTQFLAPLIFFTSAYIIRIAHTMDVEQSTESLSKVETVLLMNKAQKVYLRLKPYCLFNVFPSERNTTHNTFLHLFESIFRKKNSSKLEIFPKS